MRRKLAAFCCALPFLLSCSSTEFNNKSDGFDWGPGVIGSGIPAYLPDLIG